MTHSLSFGRCVPGVFFDINPRGVKHVEKSICISNVRFSYGPAMPNLTTGVKNMKKMIDTWAKKSISVGDYVKAKAQHTKQQFHL